MSIRSFLNTMWKDIKELPINFIKNRDVLLITGLLILPWLIDLIRSENLNSLQPLTWIFGLIAFYWLIGHNRPLSSFEFRKPRLELFIALILVATWIIYRIGEYGHWYVVPTFGLGNSCGPISETPYPKMVEMFLLPVIFLLILRYSFSQMGFDFDKFSWLAALLPLIALIVFGLINHKPQAFAVSSLCYFFGAGLPEEFLFRAFLQTRLEALLRHPLWAVWLASFIFGASHIPIDLAGNFHDWQQALLTAFTYQMTVGFALGYAYMRTRSVMPVSLIHTFIDSSF